ncbi:NAC domain-containing protein [Forsythia ovata]|uniref:NAC domain-containing protein n=1 Tax=Forsythia ovata TaxID=205694 RepID=A0ABD1UUC8_9LAMI
MAPAMAAMRIMRRMRSVGGTWDESFVRDGIYMRPLGSVYSGLPQYVGEDFCQEFSQVNGVREMYFFTPRQKKYKNGQRPSRITIDGYWKATGADKTILHNGESIGCERSLVFYRGIPSRGVKTSWLMHEFKVDNLPPRQPTHEDDMRIQETRNPVAHQPELTQLYDELPEIPTMDELLVSATAGHEELPEIPTMDINVLLGSDMSHCS